MNVPASLTIPVEHRAEVCAFLLAGVAFVAGFAASLLGREKVVTQTDTVKVSIAQQYGKPAQRLAGAQVNPQLAGYVCDNYPAKATLICHR